MGREEAVKHTVDTCIREGILRQLGQQSYEEGVAAGIEQGRTEGRSEGVLVGEEQIIVRQVCTKLKKGKKPEVIAEELEEDLAKVKAICEAAEAFAPEYDWKAVYEACVRQKIG